MTDDRGLPLLSAAVPSQRDPSDPLIDLAAARPPLQRSRRGLRRQRAAGLAVAAAAAVLAGAGGYASLRPAVTGSVPDAAPSPSATAPSATVTPSGTSFSPGRTRWPAAAADPVRPSPRR
ncbi:hypothetical protein [Actinoplanes sp. URMC 104]|uniref:hypothetical protein n=1 Tax=Actinoplanes sp. URMC 104 TaxID=3423409 RepID=UPI003F1D55A1